jgi:hypothetical protein
MQCKFYLFYKRSQQDRKLSISLITLSILLLTGFAISAFPQQTANYDESKVPDLVIPDLFVTYQGKRVRSVQEWESVRKPEILRAFAEHMYGQLPLEVDNIEYEVETPAINLYSEVANYKVIQIKVFRNGNSQTIPLHLFTPNNKSGPFPVILLISHRPVEKLILDINDQFFSIQKIVERGYAAAAFDVEFVSPDDKERFEEGILKFLYPEQMTVPNGMRGLSAWAWGAMRAMDYFEMDPILDPTRSAVVGHSRGGKAALWCGANDSRWAVTYSNESGCGGAALSRRKFGESVERINSSFPYWFTPNFDAFNGKEETLPFDQHQLISTFAPRAVYVASAMEDLWSDPKGEYLSLKLASRIYGQFYGQQPELPEEFEFIPHFHHAGKMGYHLRDGKHNLIGEDWEKFLDFVAFQFDERSLKPGIR